MTYSQKYCLVHFITPTNLGAQFNMSAWPLHTTLADVFSIDRKTTDIDAALKSLCEQHPAVTTTATSDSQLGETPVVLLDNTPELYKFHSDIVTVLEQHGVLFNTPAFTKDGFIPHSTIQNNHRLDIGRQITIDSIALVDMFPDDDWQQRKVIAIYKLLSDQS